MQITVQDQAPIYQFIAEIGKTATREQVEELENSLVRASLALLRRHFTCTDRSEIMLACEVTAGILSLGMKENPTEKAIKNLFQVGWKRIMEARNLGEKNIKQFFPEIRARPYEPWSGEAALYAERELSDQDQSRDIFHKVRKINKREEIAYLSKLLGMSDALKPEEYEPYNEQETRSLNDEEIVGFLQLASFGKPRNFISEQEITSTATCALNITGRIDASLDELARSGLISEKERTFLKLRSTKRERDIINLMKKVDAQDEIKENVHIIEEMIRAKNSQLQEIDQGSAAEDEKKTEIKNILYEWLYSKEHKKIRQKREFAEAIEEELVNWILFCDGKEIIDRWKERGGKKAWITDLLDYMKDHDIDILSLRNKRG